MIEIDAQQVNVNAVKIKPMIAEMIKKNKKIPVSCETGIEDRRRPTLPQIAVPSALTGLTSLFGMGRGGTPLQ